MMNKNNNVQSKPYMGNLTSSQIGNMLKAGALGGEMIKGAVRQQEFELMNQLNNDMPSESLK
jgi:hypothetical protein